MKKLTRVFAMLFACIPVAVADEADTRSVIQLSPQHRALVLTEMRQFLSGLQQIMDALSRDDMETVAREARTLGTSMSHHMPSDLKQALPQQFRKMGHAVHSSFDQIALDAESLGDTQHAQSQLGDTLSRCVSCHSTYQIQVMNDH
jgi:hypothetical protein